jgi:CBS domain-containing protein
MPLLFRARKMFRRIAVGDIMTRKPATVKPSADLHACAKEFVKQRVNSLLLTEGKKLVGILTARDILWTLTKKPKEELKNIKAIDVASKKVAVIKPSADIDQAVNKMKKVGFRRLPVISKGALVGIVTLRDILRIDPTIYREVSEITKIREESEKLRKIKAQEEENWDAEGICEECDSFAPLLKVESRLLCPDCRDELY